MDSLGKIPNFFPWPSQCEHFEEDLNLYRKYLPEELVMSTLSDEKDLGKKFGILQSESFWIHSGKDSVKNLILKDCAKFF